MPLILGTNSIKDTGFDVANSLRLDGSSAKLTKNNPSATSTNDKKGTFSWWWKRGRTEETNYLISQISGQERFLWYIISSGAYQGNYRSSSGSPDTDLALTGTPLFRDCTGWMHCVLAYDTSLGTQLNRVRFYVNNVEYEVTQSQAIAQDTVFSPNKSSFAGTMELMAQDPCCYVSGYLSEFCFVDGQQLTPSSFAEADEDSPNIWKPKKISGLTFGNLGYYLDFKDSSNLGNDVSGNTDDFTASNIAATDQSTDTPTNNFATWNPLMVTQDATVPAMSEGNLKATFNNAGLSLFALSTFAVSSGKWFAEFKMTNIHGGTDNYVGIVKVDADFDAESAPIASGTIYRGSGQKGINGSYSSYGATYATGDIIGVALNCDDNEVVFYKNGASQGAISITADTTYYMFTSDYDSKVIEANFGSPSYSESGGNSDGDGYGNFSMSVPANHYCLNTKNLGAYGG